MTATGATRASVERARAELDAERKALVEAERRLSALSRTTHPELRSVTAAVGVSALLCVALGASAAWTASSTPDKPPPPPAELVARRDQARSELAAERARPDPPAAPTEPEPEREPIPPRAYRALETLREQLAADQEGILAWTQIGWAACTAQEEPLARLAWAKLDFEAMRSRRASAEGKIHPGISTALRTLDDRCQERGIHLGVPVPR